MVEMGECKGTRLVDWEWGHVKRIYGRDGRMEKEKKTPRVWKRVCS